MPEEKIVEMLTTKLKATRSPGKRDAYDTVIRMLKHGESLKDARSYLLAKSILYSISSNNRARANAWAAVNGELHALELRNE